MRWAFAILLFLHGFAHLVGFVGPWRLMKDVPYISTILYGRIDLGDAGIKALAVVWLLTGLTFAAAAIGAGLRLSWWPSLALGVACVSLVLSILALPEARIGVGLNVLIIALLLVGSRLGWTFLRP